MRFEAVIATITIVHSCKNQVVKYLPWVALRSLPAWQCWLDYLISSLLTIICLFIFRVTIITASSLLHKVWVSLCSFCFNGTAYLCHGNVPLDCHQWCWTFTHNIYLSSWVFVMDSRTLPIIKEFWLTLHVSAVMLVALEGVFFPKKRYERTKNGFVYSKKTCDCDFGILNSYFHQSNPEKYIGYR